MKIKFLLAATIAFAASAPVLAADKESGDQAAPKEKKICRTETITGSLVTKHRICLTQAQWDEMAERTRRDMNNLNRSSNLGGETGGANGANNNAGL